MGCGGSNSKPTAEAARRRLSIGQTDNPTKENDSGGTEEDRGLLTALSAENVIEMLQQNDGIGDRKFSVGSESDTGKTSFANKTMQQIGDKLDPGQAGLGFTCRKGLKPESPNQDSWSVLKVDNDFAIYGVFDGHGQKGHDVSNFVKDNLPKLIIRDQRFRTDDMPASLVDAFKKMQSLIVTADRMKKLSAQLSGTTCTIVVHDFEKKKLTFAHVADSTSAMAQELTAGKITGKAMTRDHKPDLKDEKARIEKAGGRVVFDGYANHRIYVKNGRYPGLNMSRCLGDIIGQVEAGVSCEPEVTEYQIQPTDKVLLLCSDGVWEFIEPSEAAALVCQYTAAKAMTAADKLAKEAWDRWIKEEGGAVVDDITVVAVYLPTDERQVPANNNQM